MPLTLEDKHYWLEKLKRKYPFVLEQPFRINWRPADLEEELDISLGYVPIKEEATKYFLFESQEDLERAEDLMKGLL